MGLIPVVYLLLQPNRGLAIVPAPLTTSEQKEQVLDALPALPGWARGAVLIGALLLITVFAIAFWLNPYDENGQARLMETHRQLGLPPCTFRHITGLPCPSCGMTSSFALLAHGDLKDSLRANAVGTLLAVIWAAAIPWLLICSLTGRPWGWARMERTILWLLIGFLALLFLRWFIVLAMIWLGWN